jgi:hypothetical protein
MNRWIARSLFTGSALLLVARAYTYVDGPPANYTGAPGESTCVDCHSSHSLNESGGSMTISGIPASYMPGAVYPLTVHVARTGQSRWGFEMTALKADGSRGGEWDANDVSGMTRVVDTNNEEPTVSTPQYIEQTYDGSLDGRKDAAEWIFNWTAPAKGSGTVSFYAAGNAANGNLATTGDYIYSTSAQSAEGSDIPAVTYGDLNGDGKVNIQDATLALRMAVGLTPPTDSQTQAGDVAPVPGSGPRAGQPFGDGKIDIADATRILRYAIGLTTQWS